MSDHLEDVLEYDSSEDEDSDAESDTLELDTAPWELEDSSFGAAQRRLFYEDHTATLCARLEQSGDIARRVRNVLDFMTTQSLNLPLYLWGSE
ncbi:hypothetical protein CERSUDRAFT_101336 [Gelatoporia subvermispora B]|uniref:Uncharacterized protein n=1 Tax=Ceriporiopsis subvermispora (strain B) TaxID=914234 RepID=M2Q0Y1_CERS8|nr:hypothetical protein CERSUDRAFT_101336 [Gelatoporia subvermispora B]